MESYYANITQDNLVELTTCDCRPPTGRQVQVKALYSSISAGTEYDLIAGNILPLPQPLGYSLCAEVVALGDECTNFSIGDYVVATATHASMQNLDERLLAKVPSQSPLDQAAFFNLAHTALYGIRRTQLKLGEPCLILGQGIVGLLTTMLAKCSGAGPIVTADLEDKRLQYSTAMGADETINIAKNPSAIDALLKRYNVSGFPVVYEATGTRSALKDAVDYIDERGRLMMLSQSHGDSLAEVAHKLMMKGASLIGGYVNSKPYSMFRSDLEILGAWPPVINQTLTRANLVESPTSLDDIETFLRLLALGRIDLGPMITHRFTWQDIPRAYDLVKAKETEMIGAVIDWTK